MGSQEQQDTAPESARAPRIGISGYWQLFREGYDELVKAIIRPPRAEYEMDELGPERFEFAGVSFERQDLQLRNGRGLALQSSMWRRRVSPEGGTPCVIYLHGNASCRAEALQAHHSKFLTRLFPPSPQHGPPFPKAGNLHGAGHGSFPLRS